MATATNGALDLDALADLAVGYLSGAAVSALVCLGDQLGLYRTLADIGPATSSELAASTDLDERWVREWLHGQTGAALVQYSDDGRFELTAEQAALLADEDSPAFLAGGFGLLFSLFERWERLHDAFRTGRGTPYNDLGSGHARNESRFSAPWMRANLVPVILPGLDGVTAKLAGGPRPRTSVAGPAGRPWRWRRPTRSPSSTGSTSPRSRSTSPGRTWPPPG